MRFPRKTIRGIPAISCTIGIAATLVASSGQAFAYLQSDPLEHIVERLPDLPGTADAPSGYVDMNGDGAGFGYASRSGKWSARLDRYLDMGANLELDYGMLVTSKLGAGGRLTRSDSFSEFVVNGVFAPQKNVRVRVTGAQLRNEDRFALFAAGYDDAIVQNSFLLTARKYWSKYVLLSDLGVTAYSTQTTMPSMVPEDELELGSESDTYGRKDGYLLNLGLRPTPSSRLELRREFSHLSTYFGDDARGAAQRNASGVKYSHYLDNCVRLQGGVTAGTGNGRLDLNIARNNWNINFSREQLGDIASTAVRIGYMLPLGRQPSRSSTCSGTGDATPPFEPIVDSSASRPAQLPAEPIFMETP